MKQLVGNGVRPGELGNTGIIVLTKCDMGVCDCNQATVYIYQDNKLLAPVAAALRKQF